MYVHRAALRIIGQVAAEVGAVQMQYGAPQAVTRLAGNHLHLLPCICATSNAVIGYLYVSRNA